MQSQAATKADAYLTRIEQAAQRIRAVERTGFITQIVGLTVEASGLLLGIGELCRIYMGNSGEYVTAEVKGFKADKLILMPLGRTDGLSPGDRIVSTGDSLRVGVTELLRGRILGALGEPIDDGPILYPDAYYAIDNDPPNPMERARVKDILPIGVRSIDGFLTMGVGQRLGIFAGSGVGKSTLLGMIARNSGADINVIVLVGERGREVKDFIEKDLQAEGLRKTVLVVATSDLPPLMRLKSAMVGTSIAEFFRDKGYKVMLMMDSLTRFAMAQREIGMAVGEPPVSRGYTPSVYAMLPRLLERAGTSAKGSITAIYTVLVEGDDMNEPISDTVRGILDGHIILSRKIANNNHYPPIDILGSISRLMKDIVPDEHYQMASHIRNLLATYRDSQDLISIGAYKQGSNPAIDEAVRLNKPINDLLKQGVDDICNIDQTVERMRTIK